MDGQETAEPDGAASVTSNEPAPAVVPAPMPPPAPIPYTPSPYAPPPTAPPVHMPPPQSAPMAYTPPPTPPPAANPRRTGRLLLIIGLIVVLILAAAGGGAVLANASLSNTYSPEKAVTDFLAAQKRGDSSFMMANANFLKGDGSYTQFFDKSALDTMMAYPQNTAISDVKVVSTTAVDSNTRTVNVTMTWNGHRLQPAFTVHRDLNRVHFQFFNSWRIDMPFASIHLTLPNQPGGISVDSSPLPPGATADIQVIQGFHKVSMNGTDLYDSASADADAIAGNPSVVFPSKISTTAKASAVSTVKAAFTVCSASQYTDCLNHTYNAPNAANTIYYFNMPGYGEVDYTKYVFTLTKDPTTNMTLVITADAGKVSVSGACFYTMTVDGTRKYYFKGTWSGTLTMSAGTFSGYDLIQDCAKSKA